MLTAFLVAVAEEKFEVSRVEVEEAFIEVRPSFQLVESCDAGLEVVQVVVAVVYYEVRRKDDTGEHQDGELGLSFIGPQGMEEVGVEGLRLVAGVVGCQHQVRVESQAPGFGRVGLCLMGQLAQHIPD